MITFRSPAAADVMMFDDVAKRMLEVIGKEFADTGIVTVEQLPAAIARLREAIAADRARERRVAEDDRPRTEEAPGGVRREYVALAQRAVPLAELFEYSLKADKPVIWSR